MSDENKNRSRNKRTIKKPKRFQTTSSDEAPQTVTTHTKGKNGDIDNDINELRNVLQEESSATEYSSDENENETHKEFSKDTSKIIVSTPSETNFQFNSQSTNPTNISKNTLHQPASTNITSSYVPFQHTPQTNTYTSSYTFPFTPNNNNTYNDQQYISHTMPHTSTFASPSTYNTYTQLCQQSDQNQFNSCTQQTNNSLPRSLNSSENTNTHVTMQSSGNNDDRLYKRLDDISQQIQNLYNIVQTSLKTKKKNKNPPKKPEILPITSMEEMEAFEHVEHDVYLSVVHYFQFLGGFNIKEAITMCLKEAVHDTLTSCFTWWGYEDKKAFSETRVVRAIFEATCNNEYFNRPTRFEFQKHMKESLRTAQERNRQRGQKNRQVIRIGAANRNYWNNNNEIPTNRENTQ